WLTGPGCWWPFRAGTTRRAAPATPSATLRSTGCRASLCRSSQKVISMDRQDGKRLLHRLREQRGWSWADEARAIKHMAGRLGVERLAATSVNSIKRTIARWESDAPTATVPDERYQWVLAHLFAERDGRCNIGPGSEFLRLLAAFQAMGVSA